MKSALNKSIMTAANGLRWPLEGKAMQYNKCLFSVIFLALALCISGVQAADWDSYGGVGGQQYTELDQISAENLDDLGIAWTCRTGDLNQGFARKGHSFQTNPLFWNGALFITTISNCVQAVNAKTGTELWRFDPNLPKEIGYSESASRGVSLWHGESTVCPHRLFIGTHIGEIIALDAETGELCHDFADGGRADMSVGVGEVSLGNYGITSPPAVMGDRLIVGSAIGNNRAVELERGIVRSLDVRSGAINWIWDPIPRSPSEPNYASWENDSGLITGAANVWPPITVDTGLDLVFVSTGSPSPDFYGGERLGDNHHANSLVALNGTTGAVVWSQQTVHHDTWDYDIPSQPTLTEIERNGRRISAVMVVTKTGELFAFERASGELIYEITERPVPASDVPGELLSPTQPFSSVPPLVDQSAITVDDAYGILFFDKRACQQVIRNSRSEGVYTPISLRGTIESPSYAGGANWGGVAVDSERQIAITNVNQIPALVRLIPQGEVQGLIDSGEFDGDWQLSRQEGTPFYMARRIFLSSLGLPCTKPPWGKLVAVDLRAGDILWDVPFGTIRNIAPGIVPNFAWGVPNMGGPLLTRSGLIFIGAAAEHIVRIFDIQSGEELWQHDVPAAPIATPMSYEVDSEQYIAIAVGGYDNLDLERGDYLVSFKLQVAN